MKEERKYPYQNRSLVDLDGEQWEDIPGLDGYFRVSNCGRIKRLARESVNSRGRVIRYKEMIIAPRLMLAPNHFVGDATAHLFAHLEVEGKRFHLPIRRLVYHCFAHPIDLHDKSIHIICRNGNGLDLRPRNLKAVSKSEASKRILKLNRRTPEMANADPVKAMLVSLEYTCKPVTQYDQDGKKVETFPSTMEAYRQTGISHSHIGNAATGREQSAGGYFWAFGDADSYDVEGHLNKRRQGYKEKKGTKVTQYDLQGNRIAQYLTLRDAAAAIGKDYTGISANLRGVTVSAYGFVWRSGWGKAQINVTGLVVGNELRAQRRHKPVEQYSADEKHLQTFPSVKAASEAVGVTHSFISSVLDKGKLAGGFLWKSKGH